MACPKCGEVVAAGSVICPRCDYILDTTFLGDDFLDESTHSSLPAAGVSSAADALVLGGLDEDVEMIFSESTGSFLTADTIDVDRRVLAAPVYIGKSLQELLKPEAVLGVAPDIALRRQALSPFEQHVLSFIDGIRPVARLRKKTGLSRDDMRIALGMLAEKGAVGLVGTIAPPDPATVGEDVSVDDDAADNAADDGSTGFDDVAGEMTLALDVSSLPDEAPSPWNDRTTAEPDAVPAPPAPPAPPARRSKEQAASFFQLAQGELARGNRARAHIYARLAADTDPSEPAYQELLRSWTSPARISADADAVLYADADLAEKQGNHLRALTLLQQAIALNPKGAHLHNRLGLLLAARFRRFADAGASILTAVELEPTNVAYKNNLGKIIALADERGARIADKPGPGPRQPMPAPAAAGGLLGKLKKAFD